MKRSSQNLKNPTILSLILVIFFIISQPINSLEQSKISIALNCGSKTDEVSSSDNTFKYKPVNNKLILFRIVHLYLDILLMLIIILIVVLLVQISNFHMKNNYTCLKGIPIKKWSIVYLSNKVKILSS